MISKIKNSLHPKNRHQGRYNFKLLTESCPQLKQFVKLNEYDKALGETIDFSDPQAVMTLNKALLKFYYGISFWELPSGFLCPPIPGRADYIHYLADLLSSTLEKEKEKSKNIKVLDIGTGANCIYPLIGQHEYAWDFVGSEVDLMSLKNAEKIINGNLGLEKHIELRLQKNSQNIFKGLILPEDYFELTLCNPPFYSSYEEAQGESLRKWKNLGKNKEKIPARNFGGKKNELWCKGGEKEFIKLMIEESTSYKKQVLWFSTLVSKGENLPEFKLALKKVSALDIRIIEMGQGQKRSRILAWTF